MLYFLWCFVFLDVGNSVQVLFEHLGPMHPMQLAERDASSGLKAVQLTQVITAPSNLMKVYDQSNYFSSISFAELSSWAK